MNKGIPQVINVNGEDITVYRVNNDVNGNPRYVVHFLTLGVKLKDYGKIPGLVKYRGKWFGGGYVFQAYDVADTLDWMRDQVKQFYSKYRG